jgi:hypothetical protein
MDNPDYEIVHTMTDWYDGARAGIANLNGVPHYYECRWDDTKSRWSEVYLLNKIDDETFQLAIEDWQIWLRWEKAFHEGRTTQETHPALPEDRERHKELEEILARRLVIYEKGIVKAKGEFEYGQQTLVKWSVVV